MKSDPDSGSRALRKRGRQFLDQLARRPEIWRLRSQELASRFLALASDFKGDLLRPSSRVGLYSALPGEFDASVLLDRELRSRGIDVAYPRVVDPASRRLEYFLAPSDSKGWVKGSFGILEPGPEAQQISITEMDWILVPGLAFGSEGARVGRGAGYFDRCLVRAKQAVRIALAWDELWQDKISSNPWDQSMDWILTEQRDARTERIR